MKVYISCDMEGATGVVRREQVDHEKPEYEFGRAMQLHDLLAVAEAALEFGADEVLVNDSHSRMINLDARRIPKGLRLVSGSGKYLSMMEQVEGADLAFFVCYHAKAGTLRAILDHTMTGNTFDLTLNGVSLGELGFNAAVAGHFGVPPALVTGDAAVCREAKSVLGDDITVCAVKEGVARTSAVLLPPEETAALLRKAVKEAMACSRKAVPYRPAFPGRVELTVLNCAQADAAAGIPGAIRMSGRTLAFEAKDTVEAYCWFRSALSLAGTVPR